MSFMPVNCGGLCPGALTCRSGGASEVFAQELSDVDRAKELLKALLRSSSMSFMLESC